MKKYELSKFLSLEGDIHPSGERVVHNIYTGAKLSITSEVVQILAQFKTGSNVESAARRLGLKGKKDLAQFANLCDQLIRSSILLPVDSSNADLEAALRTHLDNDPLSVVPQTLAHCPSKRLVEVGVGDIAVLGVPLDTATSAQPGTRFGPDAIREMSSRYIAYGRNIFSGLNQGWFNADVGRVILAETGIVDLGNIVVRADDDLVAIFERISRCAEHLAGRDAKLVSLGGDHSISAPLIGAYAKRYPELAVLHLDAHTDLAPWLPGRPHHHGSFMRRVMHEAKAVEVYQIGARGFSGEALVSNRYHFYPQGAVDVMFEGDTWRSSLPQGKKCYITLDVDVLDPTWAPGVGTPVPFGMEPKALLKILETVAGQNEIVAIDIVELCPTNDRSGSTANLIFHLLMNLMARAWDK